MATDGNAGLRQLFEQLDKNGSGFIDGHELDFFLTIMGVDDPAQRAEQVRKKERKTTPQQVQTANEGGSTATQSKAEPVIFIVQRRNSQALHL